LGTGGGEAVGNWNMIQLFVILDECAPIGCYFSAGVLLPPQIPIFKGDSYEFWSIKMKTLFISQDLWEYVESGHAETSDDNNRNKENQKPWSILKTEYQGSTKVITVKLQSLRREFETFYMKNRESVQAYMARVSAVVSQMRSYGEKISDEIVVAKVLRSLTPNFDHVVAAIEESKDLSNFSFDELMGSL
nr:UBN2 domain-containing protein [Tanacetum cinerariifolium]